MLQVEESFTLSLHSMLPDPYIYQVTCAYLLTQMKPVENICHGSGFLSIGFHSVKVNTKHISDMILKLVP